MFPTLSLLAKKPPIGIFVNSRVLRDQMKREAFAENEQVRQALRYISQNTTLSPRQRAYAQLQLATMHCHTRSTQFKNRCIVGGKGKGVFRDFRMARYQFRLNALEGNLPGVKKASW
ncbi:putative mitochondrial 40s ribosomal protein [Kalaharituber pfeilii]|nr:putative mitochondrial 40s ribosomal protein [Kalaharituber pfeilii]